MIAILHRWLSLADFLTIEFQQGSDFLLQKTIVMPSNKVAKSVNFTDFEA